MHYRILYIQWHHSKFEYIYIQIFKNFPWGACLQIPLDSNAAYFAPSRLMFWVVPWCSVCSVCACVCVVCSEEESH